MTEGVFHAMRRIGWSLILLIGGCGGVPLGGASSCGCDGGCPAGETTGGASAPLTDADAGGPADGESTVNGETPDAGTAPDAAVPEEPALAEPEAVESDGTEENAPPGETLSEPAPGVAPALYPTSVDDPFAYPSFGPEYAPDLLSLYLDALAIGTLGSTGGVNTSTYLEQLCLDGGAPEYYCRQLYADDDYD
jgi:hypothetical protein